MDKVNKATEGSCLNVVGIESWGKGACATGRGAADGSGAIPMAAASKRAEMCTKTGDLRR